MQDDRARLRDQRRIAQKMGGLIEFTNLLDRNKEDNTFLKRNDGVINYVFDVNIFQAFVLPSWRPRFLALFHAQLWGVDNSVAAAINADATLVASEFILSLAAPPQGPGRLFMSRRHIEELEVQMQHLTDDLGARASAPDAESKIVDHLGRFSHMLDMFDSGDLHSAELIELISKDKDFPPIEKFVPKMPKDKRDFIISDYFIRKICRLLSMDLYLETVDQLQRFYSDSICGKLRTLEIEYGVDSRREQEFTAERIHWRRRIREEIELSKNASGASRSPLAIDNDACTLAMLQWLQKENAENNARFVFVTGDRILYKAYLRWYLNHGAGTFFLIRPLAQYAPLLNMSDAGARFASARTYFEQTRTALEAQLLALNLGLMRTEQGRANQSMLNAGLPASWRRSRAKDAFFLDVEDGDPRSDVMEPMLEEVAFLGKKDAELDAAIAPMLELEKFAIGALPNMIAPRLSREKIKYKRDLVAKTKSMDGAATKWLNEKLDVVRNNGIRFTLLAAKKFVFELVTEQKIESRRAPIALRLLFPFRGEKYTAVGIIDMLRAQPSLIPNFLEEIGRDVYLLFALASVLAFRHGHWREAVRFTEIVVPQNSGEVDFAGGPGTNRPDEEVQFECRYLRALALRFRLADARPQVSQVDHDHWRSWMNESVDLLDQCLEFHASAPAGRQVVRELRAAAERAAMRLSYCSWVALSDIEQISAYRDTPLDIASEFEAGVKDLERAREMLGVAELEVRARAQEGIDFTGQDVLDHARLQTLANSVAAKLVLDLLRAKARPRVGSSYLAPDPAMDARLERLQPADGAVFADPTSPPIVKGYGALWRLSRGLPVDSADSFGALREETLPLDEVLLGEVVRVLKRAESARIEGL